jgi:hypothetical protein
MEPADIVLGNQSLGHATIQQEASQVQIVNSFCSRLVTRRLLYVPSMQVANCYSPIQCSQHNFTKTKGNKEGWNASAVEVPSNKQHRQNTEAPSCDIKKVGLLMREKTTQTLNVNFSSSQYRTESLQSAKKSFENTAKLNCMGTNVTNTNYIHKINYEQKKIEIFFIHNI